MDEADRRGAAQHLPSESEPKHPEANTAGPTPLELAPEVKPFWHAPLKAKQVGRTSKPASWPGLAGVPEPANRAWPKPAPPKPVLLKTALPEPNLPEPLPPAMPETEPPDLELFMPELPDQ